MTELIQTLEKLAELDGDWIEAYEVGFSIGDSSFFRDELDDRDELFMLFGAICEKVEALPKHEIELRDLGPFWKVTIWIVEDDKKDPKYTALSFKNKNGNPATAAAKALLAALKAKQSEVSQ